MILNVLFTVLSCTIISDNTVRANAFIKITDTILFSDYFNQSKHIIICAIYVLNSFQIKQVILHNNNNLFTNTILNEEYVILRFTRSIGLHGIACNTLIPMHFMKNMLMKNNNFEKKNSYKSRV